ncbi:hypothetical protein [Nannocystis pusilla]|uniref:hypothetical protein n=1 Tax=Nannocystis pusilla TaxID=889268 RepID=UPI003B7BAE4B
MVEPSVWALDPRGALEIPCEARMLANGPRPGQHGGDRLDMIPEDKRKLLEVLYAVSFELYRAGGPERGRVHAIWWERDDDDDPLGVMEVRATDIGGYAARIVDCRKFDDLDEAIGHLRRLLVLDDPTLARFCREHGDEYPNIVGYLRMLETVRLEAIAILAAARDARA